MKSNRRLMPKHEIEAIASSVAAGLIEDAREWLVECFEAQEDEIMEAPAAVIVWNVEKHYDGGWLEYVASWRGFCEMVGRPFPEGGAA